MENAKSVARDGNMTNSSSWQSNWSHTHRWWAERREKKSPRRDCILQQLINLKPSNRRYNVLYLTWCTRHANCWKWVSIVLTNINLRLETIIYNSSGQDKSSVRDPTEMEIEGVPWEWVTVGFVVALQRSFGEKKWDPVILYQNII